MRASRVESLQLADAVFQHIGRLLDVVEAIGQILVGAGPAVSGHDLALGVDREGMGQLVHPVALRGIVAQVDEHLRFVVVEPRGVVDDRLPSSHLSRLALAFFVRCSSAIRATVAWPRRPHAKRFCVTHSVAANSESNIAEKTFFRRNRIY